MVWMCDFLGNYSLHGQNLQSFDDSQMIKVPIIEYIIRQLAKIIGEIGNQVSQGQIVSNEC